MLEQPLEPGLELVRRVRTKFILKGTTLTRWCRENNLQIGNARMALYGNWNGPKGKAFRQRILEAAGVES